MAFPTLFSLAGLTLAVLAKDLVGYTDLVINRGLSAGTVAWIAFYQAMPMAARTLPFAAMLGCLVALGRLGADGELLALETCGTSPSSLIAPIMAFAGVMTVMAFGLSIFGAPWANRALDSSLEELSRQKPGAAIQAGTVHRFGNWKLEAREVSSRGDRMRGVLLWVPDLGKTVFAERGRLDPNPDGSTRITLENATVVLKRRRAASQLRFEHMTTRLPGTEELIIREDADRIAGEKLAELVGLGRSEEAPGDRVRLARIELQRRFALPSATLVFGVLALPLFLSRARLSRAGGGALGIATIVVYYGLVQLGDGLIEEGTVGVTLGVWLPNLVLGAAALVLVLRLGRMSASGRRARPSRERWSGWLSHRGFVRAKQALTTRRWALQRYIASEFLRMAALCLLVLLVAYLVVDVLERLQFFAKYDASGRAILRYYGARVFLLASRVVPMSLLVATALTVSLFAARNELMAIPASGIPAPRALLPILAICALIAPCYFALNDVIVPRTNALATYVKNIQIRGREATEPARALVWYRVRDHVYEAKLLDPEVGIARNITIYRLGENGFPVSWQDARAANHIGGGVWRLVDPVRIEISTEGLEQVPAARFAELGEDIPARLATSHLSVGDLRGEIGEVENAGYDATPYRVDLWAKIAAPFACVLLPALALFFALESATQPRAALTLLFTLSVAVSYILLTGIGASLGYGGALPPVLAGAGPIGIVALLATYFAFRLRGVGESRWP